MTIPDIPMFVKTHDWDFALPGGFVVVQLAFAVGVLKSDTI